MFLDTYIWDTYIRAHRSCRWHVSAQSNALSCVITGKTALLKAHLLHMQMRGKSVRTACRHCCLSKTLCFQFCMPSSLTRPPASDDDNNANTDCLLRSSLPACMWHAETRHAMCQQLPTHLQSSNCKLCVCSWSASCILVKKSCHLLRCKGKGRLECCLEVDHALNKVAGAADCHE